MRVCVIPTNRPAAVEPFMEAWRHHGGWDELLWVWDGDVWPLDNRIPHITHQHIPSHDDGGWIFSRGDSAIRSFGFLEAARRGATWIGTLDDDCFPEPADPCSQSWFDRHRQYMQLPRWRSSVPGLRVRGLPYETAVYKRVPLSMGLWSGVPDLDAVEQLHWIGLDDQPPASRVEEPYYVPAGQYVPLCGMNMVFHRDLLPLMYFPLQGQGQPYRRWDDIWCGVLAKKLLDALGLTYVISPVYVRHERASDPFRNLAAEAAGIDHHRQFWREVDAVPVVAETAVHAVRTLALGLAESKCEYSRKLASAMLIWLRLLEG